jgi:hypothetical protein
MSKSKLTAVTVQQAPPSLADGELDLRPPARMSEEIGSWEVVSFDLTLNRLWITWRWCPGWECHEQLSKISESSSRLLQALRQAATQEKIPGVDEESPWLWDALDQWADVIEKMSKEKS